MYFSMVNYFTYHFTSNETATTKELWTRQLNIEGLAILPYEFHSHLDQVF